MIRYAIIIEKAEDGTYGAYVPDLPGCVGMGVTRDEAFENIENGNPPLLGESIISDV